MSLTSMTFRFLSLPGLVEGQDWNGRETLDDEALDGVSLRQADIYSHHEHR